MNIVPLKKPPSDLASILRRMADQAEAGELTGFVGVSIVQDNYEFVYSASLHDSIVMSSLLQQNCIDRMRR